MRPTPTYEEFQQFLVEYFKKLPITREDVATGIEDEGSEYDLSGGMGDSVLVIDMTISIGDHYGVVLTDKAMSEVRTVGDFHQAVCEALRRAS